MAFVYLDSINTKMEKQLLASPEWTQHGDINSSTPLFNTTADNGRSPLSANYAETTGTSKPWLNLSQQSLSLACRLSLKWGTAWRKSVGIYEKYVGSNILIPDGQWITKIGQVIIFKRNNPILFLCAEHALTAFWKPLSFFFDLLLL